MRRREFFSISSGAALAATLNSALAETSESKSPPRILLRSSWQTVNIGDIAHTPGVLSILRKHLPEARITLWPSNVDNGVEQLLLNEFPGLTIAKQGSAELQRAFAECDFLLHGSGASIVAERDLIRWKQETGKHLRYLWHHVSPQKVVRHQCSISGRDGSLDPSAVRLAIRVLS